MLNLWGSAYRLCDGIGRRDFRLQFDIGIQSLQAIPRRLGFRPADVGLRI